MAHPLLRTRLAAGTLLLVGLAAACTTADEDLPELPVFYELADFELTDHTGAPFGRADLAGKVWVVDFFFTRCPTICSELTRRMEAVGREWKENKSVGLISVTVDPEHDTPEVLDAYRRRWRVGDAWILLTGAPEAVRALSYEQFKLAFEGDLERDGDITHSSRFVLVDAQGRIRAYPSLEDGAFRTEVHRGIRKLLLELEEATAGPAGAPAAE